MDIFIIGLMIYCGYTWWKINQPPTIQDKIKQVRDAGGTEEQVNAIIEDHFKNGGT